MSATPENRLADPEQLIADLRRQLAEAREQQAAITKELGARTTELLERKSEFDERIEYQAATQLARCTRSTRNLWDGVRLTAAPNRARAHSRGLVIPAAARRACRAGGVRIHRPRGFGRPGLASSEDRSPLFFELA